jgi:hypothetical protein
MSAYRARNARLDALEEHYTRALRLALVRSIEKAVVMHEAGAAPAMAAAMVSRTEVTQVLARLYVACGDVEARLQYEALTGGRKFVSPKGVLLKAIAPPSAISRWGQRLRQFITTEGAQAVRGITETTRKIVKAVLTESAGLGDSIQVASKKLRDKVAQLAPERARRIARTELVSASNYGSLLGAEATGLQLEKFWIATPDSRTRPDHNNADGQGAPLHNGFFQVGGYRARYPGDVLLPASERCNCRCAIGYRRVQL